MFKALSILILGLLPIISSCMKQVDLSYCDYFEEDGELLEGLVDKGATYKDKNTHGMVCFEDEENNVMLIPVKNGVVDGTLSLYSQGSIVYTGQYVKGKKHGEAIEYFEKESPESYDPFSSDSYSLEDFETYIVNSITGNNDTDNTTTENIKAKYNYENDKLNGLYTEYYENGIVKSILTYKNNQRHGDGYLNHTNGRINIYYNFVNDKFDGKFIIADDKGKITRTLNFKQDILFGIQKEFYANGKLRAEFYMINDHQLKYSKLYNIDGSLNVYENYTYKNDKTYIKQTVYNRLGKLWAKVDMVDNKITSGVCANGRKWNEVEKENWTNGAFVACGKEENKYKTDKTYVIYPFLKKIK